MVEKLQERDVRSVGSLEGSLCENGTREGGIEYNYLQSQKSDLAKSVMGKLREKDNPENLIKKKVTD